MKVLLINPPVREDARPTVLPWGLVYVAQSLLDEGHEVHVLDVNAYRWSPEEVLDRISKIDFDVVGISGIITVYNYLKWITLEIKKRYPEILIIAGSYVATPIPEVIFSKTGVDIICYGEGDITAKELFSILEKGGDLTSVNGLMIKNDREIFTTPPRPLMKNLDKIPIPKSAYELFPMEIYLHNGSIDDRGRIQGSERALKIINGDINKLKSFTLLTGRGCINKCTYCYRMIRGMRKHSVDYVLEHMQYLMETYDVNGFMFTDELFFSNKKWINEFCDKIISKNTKIVWRAVSRVDMVTPEILEKMKNAGCYWLTYGFESGSQKMLDEMKKNVNAEQNCEAAKFTRDADILLTPTFMVGMPGEDASTVAETIKLIRECKIDDAGIFFTTPYPGTELYEFALKKGLIVDVEKFLGSLGDANDFTINLTRLKDRTLKKYRYSISRAIMMNKLEKSKDSKSFRKRAKYTWNKYYYMLGSLVYMHSMNIGLDPYIKRLVINLRKFSRLS